jgi:hypothetical protein
MKRVLSLIVLLIIISITFLGCSNSRVLTSKEVVEQPDRWLNENITLQGVVGPLYTSCTEAACPPENPCCNSCTAMLALYMEDSSLSTQPAPFTYDENEIAIGLEFPEGGGCKGNECEIACQPLQVGKSYTVTGLLVECYTVPRCILKVENYEEK